MAERERSEDSVASRSKDDSLADFKSPKMESAVQITSKFKTLNERRAKTARGQTSSTSRTNKSSSTSKKKNKVEKTQPSIESSFFRAAAVADEKGHTCPVCMKHFVDVGAGTVHSKNCAAKNNISTKKLLAAMALQERQAGERLAMGLPTGPLVQAKNKTARKKREMIAGDSDLQLALALSESLRADELEKDFEEALLLAAGHQGEDAVVEMSNSQRRNTLKSFGFSSNKPAAPGILEGPTKSRKKKHLGPTILQTRTKDSRERLLTERIAEILMGNEAITQIPRETSPVEPSATTIKSSLLKKIHQRTKRLWDCAELSAEVTNFYVEELASVVAPPVSEEREESMRNAENSPIEENKSPNLSEIPEETSLEKSPTGMENINVTDRQYRSTLSSDWSRMLDSSCMSDVVVFPRENHIRAHKLVIWTRCRGVLSDCEENAETGEDKISWPDVDYEIARAFLEFIYTGFIAECESGHCDKNKTAGIRNLARKYDLKILLGYLRKKKADFDAHRDSECEERQSNASVTNEIEIDEKIMENDVGENHDENVAQSAILEVTEGRKFEDSAIIEENAKGEKSKTSEENIREDEAERVEIVSICSSYRGRSESPDLFNETMEKSVRKSENSIDDDANLRVLAELIANDDVSSTSSDSQTGSIEWKKDGEGAEQLSATESIAGRSTSPLSPAKFSNDDIAIEIRKNSFGDIAETPKSRNRTIETADESPTSSKTTKCLKSNLSLFIEKVRRINSKAAVDSLAEDESLGGSSATRRFRNPFNVDNPSNRASVNSSPERNSEIANKIVRERHSGSKNEGDVDFHGETIEKSIERKNRASSVDETLFTEEENISMYSEYKRNNKRENSIVDYRELLKKMNKTSRKTEDDQPIDLTQDSDEDTPASFSSDFATRESIDRIFDDEPNASLRTRKESDVSIDELDEVLSNVRESNEKSETSSEVIEETRKASLAFSDFDAFEIDERVFSQRQSFADTKKMDDQSNAGENCGKKSYYSSSDVMKINDETTTLNSIDESSRGTLTRSRLGGSSRKHKLRGKRKSEATDSTDDSSEDSNYGNSSKLTKDRHCRGKKHRKSSPGCSFPDLSQREKNIIEEDKKTNDFPEKSCVSYDLNKYESDQYPEVNSPAGNDEIFTQSMKNLDDRSTRFSSAKTQRTPSPIVVSSNSEFEIDREIFDAVKQDSDKENSSERNASPIDDGCSRENWLARFSPLSLEESPSPLPTTSVPRFSSHYDRDFSTSAKKFMSRSISMPENRSYRDDVEKYRKSRKRSPTSSSSQESTPPKNYDAMSTPELKIELDKYGIKPMKRKRARRLLNHIYNELHRKSSDTGPRNNTRNVAAEKRDEAKKSPLKKTADGIDRLFEDSDSDRDKSGSQKSLASRTCVIPEEMDFPDADMLPTEIAGPARIRQAFMELVKADKTLHTKVLTYVPLAFESLHSTLKARGLKCKKNDLMEFLDEQCITFQVSAQSSRNRTRRAKGRKGARRKDGTKPTSDLAPV